MKVDIKFIVPSKFWSSCFSFGATSAVMPLTFFGHSWTPCGVMMHPKYLICCFLMKHLFGLGLSPAQQAFTTVSNRCTSWPSSVDPCTSTLSAHGNVPGMPAWIQSMCSQKISDDADNPKGRGTKQYFFKSVLNAVRSWLCSSAVWSCTPSWHLAWRSNDHSWSCAEHLHKVQCVKCCGSDTSSGLKAQT